MVSQREQFENEICDVLASELDQPLEWRGFLKQGGGRIYRRTTEEAKQFIVFHFEVEPRDNPNEELLVRPKLQVLLPDVSKIAAKLVAKNRLLLPAPDIVIAVPVTPNLVPSQKIGWFASGQRQRKAAIGDGVSAILKVGLTFLEEMSRAEDLITLYEARDDRIRFDSRMIIFVAAAYLLLGQKEKACSLVQKCFSQGAMARHYGGVLESVCR